MRLSTADGRAGLTAADGKAPSETPARRPIMDRMRRLLRQFWSDLTYQLSTLPASILAFTVVVSSLRLVCIAPDSVLRRLRPRPRR